VETSNLPHRRSRRFVLAGLGCAFLGACGFEPLLAQREADEAILDELASISVSPIVERAGQILRNELLDQLTPKGVPQRKRYTLSVTIQEPRQTLLLRRDDVISRSSYTAQAAFTLFDAAGTRVTNGSSSFTTDFEIAASEYATRTSIDSARARIMALIATDISNKLAQHFRGQRRAKAAAG